MVVVNSQWSRAEEGILVMDKVPDSANVIAQLFRKGQGSAD